jgi:hypothetical protein
VLTKEQRDAAIAALEAFDASERAALSQVSTKEMKAPKDNRGVVRGLVESCELKKGFDNKDYYWCVFRVVDAAPDLPAGHVIKNGYNKEVARVSADRKSMIFTYGHMDDKVNGNKAEWAAKKIDVVDEIGYELDALTGQPAEPKRRKTTEEIKNGDLVRIRMEGKHEKMEAFTLADFQISMTEYVTDPKKATLKPGQSPVHAISRVVKSSSVVRRSNRKEIMRFLRANPRLSGPIPSVAHIMFLSGYAHKHALNLADAPKDLSTNTFFLPLFPKPADYVDFFGAGPGVLLVTEEDRSVDPNDPNKVQNAHEWHKFDSPGDMHQMWRMKASMRPYSSVAELIGAGNVPPVAIFPRYTLSVPIYDNCLPFKITDMEVWRRMAPHMFKNFSMFVPAQVQLYPTAESPANLEGGSDRFEAQHLFMATKMPIHEIPEESLNKIGLELSAAGVAHLVANGRLLHGAGFALRDVRDKNAAGERTYFNLNECTQALALHMTSPSQRKQFRFVAILGKTLTPGLLKDLAAIRAYALANPNAVAGEVLLSDKWDSSIDDYMRATYGAGYVTTPGVPEFSANHVIVTEKMRTSGIIAPSETFIVYAIDIVKLKALEDEADAQDSPFAEIFTNVVPAQPALLAATPVKQLTITNGTSTADFDAEAGAAAAKAEQDAISAKQQAAAAAAAATESKESKKRAHVTLTEDAAASAMLLDPPQQQPSVEEPGEAMFIDPRGGGASDVKEPAITSSQKRHRK